MPARLILLNGPPGIGKSTLARRWVDDHALALNLDLDSVRRMLGRWEEQPIEAGLLARAMTLQMARSHLGAGHDVIIPQFLGRPEFIGDLDAVSGATGAVFVEIVLMDSREDAVGRFVSRTTAAAEPAHVEAGRMVERVGGRPALEAMYDRLLLVLAHRPSARVVQSRDGAADAAYTAIADVIDAAVAN